MIEEIVVAILPFMLVLLTVLCACGHALFLAARAHLRRTSRVRALQRSEHRP